MEARKIIKTEARRNLKDNWKNAIIVLLIIGVFSLVGGLISNILSEWFMIKEYGKTLSEMSSEFVNNEISLEEYSKAAGRWELRIISIAGAIISIIGWIFTIAKAGFFLKTSEGKNPTVKDFIKEKRFGEAFVLELIMMVKILLWALLFIIPGIVKAFSYSMAPYLKYNNPDKSATECIKESQRIMMGYKGSLFVLYLSFIGWWLLEAIAASAIGYIPGYAGSIISSVVDFVLMAILGVYVQTCVAIFYRELTNPFLDAKYNGNSNQAFAYGNGGGNMPEQSATTADPFEKKEENKDSDPFGYEENKESNGQSEKKGSDEI